jgi:hypothetical protein
LLVVALSILLSRNSNIVVQCRSLRLITTGALQLSSYAKYLATGTIVTGAMYMGTHSLLGYDQKYNVYEDISEHLDDYNSCNHRRSKPSCYVVENHEHTSYLPHLGDLAMHPLEKPEDQHHPVEHELKSTSALAATSPVLTLFSLCLLVVGMTKALAINVL